MENANIIVPSFVLEQQIDANNLLSFAESATFGIADNPPYVYCGAECQAYGYYTNPAPVTGVTIGLCGIACAFTANTTADLQLNSYSGSSAGWRLSFNNGGFSWNNMYSEINAAKDPQYGALEPLQTSNYHNTCSAASPAQQDTGRNGTTTGPAPATSCGSSFTMSYTYSVKQGNLLVVMVATYGSGVTLTVSDPTGSGGQGNTWHSAISGCTLNCVLVSYAVAKTTGSETVTITTTQSSYYTYAFILEYGGLSGTSDTSSTLNGYSGNPAVAALSPSLGSAVFAVAYGPTGWSPGTGYVMIGSSTGWNAAAQFGVDWNGATTNAPFSVTNQAYWSEAAASLK